MIGRIAAKEIGTSEESILQVASEGSVVVHAIYIVNSSGSLRRIRLHHCRNGESGAIGNSLLYDAAIAPTSTLVDATRFAMGPGDELRAKGSDSGIAILVEGQAIP